MVRHTGDYLLGTMFLAVALILQLSHASERSAAQQAGRDARHETAVNPSPATITPLSPTPAFARTRTPFRAVNAVLTNLPRGTRIVVGSLDMSGTRHQIQLTSKNKCSPNDNLLTVARFTAEKISRKAGAERTGRLSSYGRSDVNRALLQTAAFEMQPGETKQTSSISHAVFSRTGHDYSSGHRLALQDVSALPLTPTNELSPRVFLMPHFGNTGAKHEPGECRAIGESQRVRVYADQGLPQSSHSNQMNSWSEILLSAAELKALPIVETWIGPVCDVDRNQRLSIVVTDLDQLSNPSTDRSPIFGCIRENDFCPDSDFCGDIVYVDQHILELPSAELAALLTHEIAHAAICSMSRNAIAEASADPSRNAAFYAISARTTCPPWLNEAVAHFVELQCCDAAEMPSDGAQTFVTENFQRRIDAFLTSPGRSPIVASENVLNMEERRSGSRGAGTLFLAPLISTPRDLQMLLSSDDSLERRIELLTQQPFAEVFRNWTLVVASTTNDAQRLCVEKIAANFDNQRCSLLGTAFHCFECTDEIETLVLVSDESAQLQVSVIEPAVRDTHIARLNP